MAGFKYERRTAAAVEKRASQQGNDFQGFIKDEYNTYAPKKGDNWIRILPPTWKGAEHYGMDVQVHYGIGPDRASMVCNLKQFNTPCPICEARLVAERAHDEDLAKELKPSRRVAIWLLDMKDEAKGPQIWAMPWSVDRDIAKISKDKRSGEIYCIDDPDEGYDVMFDREGEQVQTKYTGLQLARRPSSVADKWIDYVAEHPLPDCLTLRSYDVVLDIFSGGMGPEVRNGSRDAKSAPPDADRGRGRAPLADEDDRPPARRSMANVTADHEDPPLRKRAAPEEEDAPPRRRSDPDAESARAREEDDAPPPRRRSLPPEDDERPASRKAAASEPEEPAPPPRRRSLPRDDKEEAPPRRAEPPATAAPVNDRAAALRERFAARKAQP